MGSSVRIIGNKAFYGCSGLSEIILPDSIEYIGEDAFAECESDDGDMTVRGSYGGYAYKYCDKYGIPFFEYIFK